MPPSFVTLPLEIRNEIYSHVFDYGHFMPCSQNDGKRQFLRLPGHTSYLWETFNPNTVLANTVLALLEVSHQISNEAATCFYGKMKFCGECHLIAAFVKGIGARRRDLIRRVDIHHLPSTASQFRKDETLELLGALPKLRTARITAYILDFTPLQNQIWEIDDTLVSTIEESCRDVYLSMCAKDPFPQRRGATFNRTLHRESPGESGN